MSCCLVCQDRAVQAHLEDWSKKEASITHAPYKIRHLTGVIRGIARP